MESDLIAYVSDTIDEFLEANPDGLVICGGDLNRLNIERLSTSTGVTAKKGKSSIDLTTARLQTPQEKRRGLKLYWRCRPRKVNS